jgi:hypothetical protein
MPLSTRIAALVACLVLAVAVFELVRKKKIREEYSLLWLAVTAVFALMVLFDRPTAALVGLLGGVNLSSLFFFGGVVFAILMLLHMTAVVSDLKRKQNVLIQELALLHHEVEVLGRSSCAPQREEGSNS